MNPKKTKSGKWHVTAYVGKVNGKPKYKSFTGDTKREVNLMVSEYIRDRKQNPETARQSTTIRDAVRSYIEVKENVLSPSTIRGYVRIYEKHLPRIYDMEIGMMDNVALQGFISSCAYLSPKTVKNIYGLLSATLNMYSDRKYNVTLPQSTEPQRKVATDEEVKMMLEAASPELRKAIILGSCSLRRGEACAARYEDLDETGIYVHADMVQDRYGTWVYKDHAKTPQSTRHVTMPPNMLEALGKGEGYIVGYASPDVVTRLMQRLSDKLGIKVTFHSLRRYYASVSHALGIPDKYIMKQGGWKSENVMRKSYQHTLDKQEQEFQDLFNRHMDEIQ